MAFTFSGGLDLQKSNKPLSGGIKAYMLPKYTVMDFSGDKKTVFTPFVSEGDAVCRYQCIGEHTTEDGEVPVYSGISGTVEEIVKDTEGQPVGIKIASDGEQKSAELEGYAGTLAELTPQAVIDLVKKAAVPCRGNFGYAWRKLLAFDGKAKRFILNLCESEPTVTSRRALIEEDLDEVLNGAKLLMKALDLRRCEITVEKENRQLLAAVTAKVKKNLLFEIRKMKQKFPQDEETALIYAVSGTRLTEADAPQSLGCAVFDAEVAAAVYRAAAFGLPYCERVVTVESENVFCPVGTPVSELLEFCGVSCEKAIKLVSGGPLRGKAFKKADDPITAETDAITVIYEKDGSPIPEMTVCNRCGRCVSVCPSGIIPYQAAELSRQKKYKKSAEYGASACCECGCCDYVCPAYIPIKKLIRAAKLRNAAPKRDENENKESV